MHVVVRKRPETTFICHLKDEDGIVDANDVGEALGKVFNSDELKN